MDKILHYQGEAARFLFRRDLNDGEIQPWFNTQGESQPLLRWKPTSQDPLRLRLRWRQFRIFGRQLVRDDS
jgi:hypothetical protein